MGSSKRDEVERVLLERLRARQPGDQLAPERELCEELGVSRQTLRRVLDDLERSGYVERRQGAGTFVCRPKIEHAFRIQSFTQDMQARRMEASSRLLSHRREMAGARLGSQLRISPGDEVLSLRRLRLADGEPMALEELSMPMALVGGLDPTTLESRSLYETLRTDHGIEISGGAQTMEATVTDPEESRLLTVPELSPALLVERVTWDQQGRYVESVRSIYRGDRYKFHLELSAAPTWGGS